MPIMPASFDRGATAPEAFSDQYNQPYARRSPHGQEVYYDLMSVLPEALKYEPKMVLAAQLMQDYLNNGYKKIPSPDYKYPLNHSHDDKFYAYAERLGLEYIKDRDIGTWAIQDSAINEYKLMYSGETDRLNADIAWPSVNIYQQYIEFISSYISDNGLALPNKVTYYTAKTWNEVSMADYSTTHEEFRILWPIVAAESHPMAVSFYGSPDTLLTHLGGYSGEVIIDSYCGNISNYNGDYNTITNIKVSGYDANDLYDKLVNYSDQDATNYIFSGVDAGVVTNGVNISIYKDPALDTTGLPLITRQINKIYEWQDPRNFYHHFVGRYENAHSGSTHINEIISPTSTVNRYSIEGDGSIAYTQVETMYSGHNSYRHDSYDRSLREKIVRLAFCHDPDVVDFEYIQLVAAQLGYDIDISIEDIQDNYYSTKEEDRDNMVRNMISNIPYYNAMKTTNNSLELIFLSMGIVAQVINLYTYGKYEAFADDYVIENAAEVKDTRGWNKSKYLKAVRAAPLKNWFPSPHFYVQVNMTSGYLGQGDLSSSLTKMLAKMLKVIKTNKPENTVFDGFYILQRISNINRFYVSGSACRQTIRHAMPKNYTTYPTLGAGPIDADPSLGVITRSQRQYDVQ
jgi:hypothetical protein